MGKSINKKKLPIGIEAFDEICSEGFYYVDKTGLIRDFLDAWGKVNLFTRPRRFGKSLNMSMFKSFFEIGCNKALFDGLEIAKETELCNTYMGRYPVISITLKGINGADYPTARSLMCSVIGNEALRFYELLINSDQLNEIEKKQYKQLIKVDTNSTESFIMPDSVLMGSLKILSTLLQKHYGERVIVLIDEYDVPLAKANEQNYYEKMIILMRNMLEQVLKTNDSLYFAILTGCLRVSKESIFTGLNNTNIFSIIDEDCDSYFGFTDNEVRKLLEYYELSDKYDVMKAWYNGYRFGDSDVYCPWDVVSYVNKLRKKRTLPPQDYWSNTSGNDIVRYFIEKVDKGLAKSEIEALVAGEIVTKDIHMDLTYDHIYDSIDNIWSVLFTTGYLTQRGNLDGKCYQLAIPNMEIRNIFTEQIMTMFKENTKRDGEKLQEFCDALEAGKAVEVERLFDEYLKRTISIRDTFVRKPTKENFYHGIMLGILGFKTDWYVKSNREAGNGFGDIIIKIEDKGIGIIIELKYAEDAKLSAECESAMKQIENTGYATELKDTGFYKILKYGIACYKKKCKVVFEEE
ncbi:AAA family ATPase [Schaedlerella arabinosiphila]|uniref:AAA family ATPase n=1 Tax=Schaedlerella arabinosiphila TaxID=2044587 RepID=UPI0025580899|nr:AAA family ATPase [Schaedlerella arabinosiphila]